MVLITEMECVYCAVRQYLNVIWLTLNSLERIEEICIILFALAMQYDILPHLTWVHALTMNPIWNYGVCWHAFSQSAGVRMLYR